MSISADAGTAHTWETMMGTDSDGNRYAGRVWADKSVFTDGQTAMLDSVGAGYVVDLNDDEAFQIIFSVLGSSMTTTTSSTSAAPVDVVIVLDNSASMSQTTNSVSRLQRVVEAANGLIGNLLEVEDIRLAIVTYNTDAQTILELGSYSNGVTLKADTYTENKGGGGWGGSSTGNGGVLTAYDDDNTALGDSSTGYQTGTNLQAGIDTGMRILSESKNATGRVPVVIVLTDGRADMAVPTSWYDPSASTYLHPSSNDVTTQVALSTLLNAAYMKARIQEHYGKTPTVYGVGVDLSSGDEAIAIINPEDASYGFNADNPNSDISTAFDFYSLWAAGQTVEIGTQSNGGSRPDQSGSSTTWIFDHNYPSGSDVGLQDVIDNIHYVDTYYNVSSESLSVTFDEIYKELTTGVFNPISSSTTVEGATGVENTPLVYVDAIGQYMQIKRIQKVTVFGVDYTVIANRDGTYTVTEATGTNPSTQESFNTAEDIRISVQENDDGTQTLRVEIDQEILPILLEKILTKTENGVTTTTIEEVIQNPLRVYYTVGLSDSVLTDGQVDVDKIAEDYAYRDAATGKIYFYSNVFDQMSTDDSDGDGYIDFGDAHVGFKPANANRYYYHQANMAIFSSVSAVDGSTINWDASEYGVLYEKGKFNLNYLTYSDYQSLKDTDTVYTYVTYYRPTVSTEDAANAAEEVTYMVYTQWGYLKESVAFYDYNAGVYINYDADNGYTTGDKGYAMEADQVEAAIDAYIAATPNANVLAVLGIGSVRTSRLHNMQVEKTSNITGTAELRYAPEYTYETAALHSGNDVVVWLGNNGRLTVDWTPEKDLTIEKIWEDSNDQDGMRPDTLTVYLKATDTTGASSTETLVLSAAEGWKKTIQVPVLNEEGNTLTYTLTEEAVAGYSGNISTSVSDDAISFTITNSHTTLKTSISVLKRWEDADDQDGIRPESIEVELYANNMATGQTVVLSDENHWTYTWESLAQYAGGQEIEYTVVELNVPDGYESDILSDEYVGLLEVVNTHEPAKTQISVNKVWLDMDDQDGLRPEYIEVELYADGNATGKKLTLKDANDWKATFTDLAVNSNGTPVIYTVREVGTYEGYSVAITGSVANGFTVTNTHDVEKTSVTVNKVWADADNQDGLRPTAITVNLYANGTKIDTQTLDATANWSYTWTGLDKNAGGQPIVYTVDEVAIDGYITTVDGLTITNTHHVAKTSMSVSKVWSDFENQDGKRPASVTVHLLADGEHTGQKIVLSDANGWAHTWTELDMYAGGLAIEYTVEEEPVEGYVATYTRDTADNSHVIITNTYDPEKTAVTVQKQWIDNHDQDGIRPDSIEVELYANGQPTGKKLTITVADHWIGNFTDLDKYANGELIQYTVKETAVPGYTTTVGVDELTGAVTVINTHIPETVDVPVNKVWVDGNDQDGIRPGGVVLELYADGIATGKTVTLNAANNWEAIFENVAKYSYGTEVIYTVQEVDVPAGYIATYSGTTVTNTHNPETLSITAKKVWVDGSNQDNLRPLSITVNLYADGVLVDTAEMNAANLGIVTFENLPKYAGGELINYTVEEADVPAGYTVSYSGSVEDGFVITNTHEVYKTQISASKVWDDANDQDGKRPASVTVHLLANGEHTGQKAVLSAANGWRHTWTDLDVNHNGTKIVYTVYEEDVAGYSVSYTRDTADDTHVIITNSYTPETTAVAVQKLWIDANDQDGLRPESIEVELYANGKATGRKLTLKAANGWEGNFTDLAVYANGTAVVYTVREVNTPAGYAVAITGSAADGFTVTNTHEVEKTSITVSKVWNDADDQDGVRPAAITVHLYANGARIATKTLDASTNWSYTWTGLDKNADGQPIVYTVDEVAVEGYVTTVKGLVITNTHEVEKTSMSVSKVWNDADNQDGKRPASITVHLLADGVHTGLTKVLNAANDWSATWTDLDKYSDGALINYTVYEAPVDGYYTTYARDSADENHVIITNHYSVEKTAFAVLKVWDDSHDKDGLRKAVVVELYANGQPTGKTVTLSESNHWTYTFADLDKMANGEPIVYTAVELSELPGYTVSYRIDEYTGIYEIVNTHTPSVTQTSVSKVWNDADDRDGIRPASVTVNLLANGAPTGLTAVLSAANGWSYTWTGLDEYHNGTKIVYTVSEDAVDGYTASYTHDAADASHLIITNSHTPKTTVLAVQKVWNDAHNQDGLRPESVEVELYANGVPTGIKATLNDANGWKHSFTGLAKFADGEEITYTVVELTKVEGYAVSYRTNSETGALEVVNTHEPAETRISVNKVWNDANDQDGLRPESIEVELYANGKATGKKLVLNGSNGWKGTFTGLAVYANGTAVVYTVREVNTPAGYTVAITGSAAEGFTVTNTHAVEKTAITVGKIWNDANDQDGVRPTVITVNLYANGTKIDTKTLDASMNWSYTWTDLDKNAGGKPIVYTVDEVTVDGYTTTVDGLVITNTHAVEKTGLSVSKVWDDSDNQDGKRPASITVHLLADGVHTGLTKVLNDANGWSAAWTDLDKYSDGVLINYTVYEAPVDGYYTTYARDSADENHVIITNHYSVEKTAFAVLKVWDDSHDKDGLRKAVVVELYANGQPTGKTVTLSESNHWTYTFTDLDEMADGAPIVYTAVKLTELPGYTVSYRTDAYTGIYEIVNTHTPAVTQISVSKVWNDADDRDGIRPGSVEVRLMANGVYTGTTVTLNAANNWSATFTDLPVYAHGAAILYTVEEVNVPDGYTVSYGGSMETGLVVTNTHEIAVRDIPVEKVWNDHDNQDGIRPGSVTIALFANGEDTGLRVTLSAENAWSAVFADVPVNSNGKTISYTFRELDVPEGYTVSYTGKTVINTHVPERTKLHVTKLWDDANDQDGIRPGHIEVSLLANGEPTGMTLVLSAETGWYGEWTDLPAYSGGTRIHYTVSENPSAGYEALYVYDGDGVTITNRHEPETVIVSASKYWDDGDNRDGIRPDKVVFVLVANGEMTDKTIELNEQNNWYGEWTDLPKYENGALIAYTVMEIDITEGYVSIVASGEQDPYTFTVTNRYAPMRTGLTAEKLWQDDNNAAGTRPESIVIALLANGVVVDTVELSEHNGWSHTWTELYQYEDGELIVYTVEEVSAHGSYIVSYATDMDQNGRMHWQITNTLVDVNPDTGDTIRPVVLMMIFSLAGVLVLLPGAKKKEQEAQAEAAQ